MRIFLQAMLVCACAVYVNAAVLNAGNLRAALRASVGAVPSKVASKLPTLQVGTLSALLLFAPLAANADAVAQKGSVTAPVEVAAQQEDLVRKKLELERELSLDIQFLSATTQEDLVRKKLELERELSLDIQFPSATTQRAVLSYWMERIVGQLWVINDTSEGIGDGDASAAEREFYQQAVRDLEVSLESLDSFVQRYFPPKGRIYYHIDSMTGNESEEFVVALDLILQNKTNKTNLKVTSDIIDLILPLQTNWDEERYFDELARRLGELNGMGTLIKIVAEFKLATGENAAREKAEAAEARKKIKRRMWRWRY